MSINLNVTVRARHQKSDIVVGCRRTALCFAVMIGAAGPLPAAPVPVATKAVSMSPAWDPAAGSGRVAYMRWDGSDYQIGVAASDGTGEGQFAGGLNLMGTAPIPFTPLIDETALQPITWAGPNRLICTENRGTREVLSFNTALGPFTRTVADGNDAAFTRLLQFSAGYYCSAVAAGASGQTLAWRTAHSGGAEVRAAPLASLDGTGNGASAGILIAAGDEWAGSHGFAVSPDGSKIVVSEDIDGAHLHWDLYLYNSGGGGRIRLTDTGSTENRENIWPAFSPDGTKILYASAVAGPMPNHAGPTDLFVVNAVGGVPARITQTATEWEIKPVWAPDGRRCAWQTFTSNWAIYQDALPSGVELGLLARYPLDGNANDATGNGHTGTVFGAAAVLDRKGTAGGAFSFDGADDYIGIPYSAAMQPAVVTLALWAERDNWAPGSFSRGAGLAGNTDSGGFELYIDAAAGELQAYVRSRKGSYVTPDMPLANLTPGWHHFAVTCDGKNTILYVDGMAVDNDSTGDGAVHYTRTNSFIIGAEASAGSSPEGDYFPGKIDEVRVYGRVLGAQEIAELASFSNPVQSPAITSAPIVCAIIGQPFAYTITASNSPVSFGATPLPPWLTRTGAMLSGTPPAAGEFDLMLSALNDSGAGQASLKIVVISSGGGGPPPSAAPAITSPLTASGTAGQPFSYTITASNSPVCFTANPLPSGLAIDRATGAITGTPAAAGSIDAVITATNSLGSDFETLHLVISPAPAVVFPRPTRMVHHQLTHFVSRTDPSPFLISASDNGDRIVTASNYKIIAIRGDGSGQQTIFETTSAVSYRVKYIDLSADGSTVLWLENVGSGGDILHVCNFDGSGHRQFNPLLPPAPGSVVSQPMQCPAPPRLTADGSTIFFVTNVAGSAIGGVWRVGADGNNLTKVFSYADMALAIWGTNGSEYNRNLAFNLDFEISDDGTRQILSSQQNGGAIVVCNSAGPPVFRATVRGDSARGEGCLAISGDGRRIAWAELVESGTTEDGLYSDDFGGGNLKELWFGPNGQGTPKGVELSRDGTVTLFNGESWLNHPEAIFATDGSWRAELAPWHDDTWIYTGAPGEYGAVLSGDGRRVIYLCGAVPPGGYPGSFVDQVWTLDLDPASPGGAPSIETVTCSPNWITPNHAGITITTAKLTARIVPGASPVTAAGFEPYRTPVKRTPFNAYTGSAAYLFRVLAYNRLMSDSGTMGDAVPGDGTWTVSPVQADSQYGNVAGTFNLRFWAHAGDWITVREARKFALVEPTPYLNWAANYFETPDAPGTASAANPDGDSLTNEQERTAGTDPANPRSVLETTEVVHAPDGTSTTVTWQSVPGKSYQIESSTTLDAAVWSPVGPSIPATGISTSAIVPENPSAPRAFKRVRVVP